MREYLAYISPNFALLIIHCWMGINECIVKPSTFHTVMAIFHFGLIMIEIGKLLMEWKKKFGRKTKKLYFGFQIIGIAFSITKFILFT